MSSKGRHAAPRLVWVNSKKSSAVTAPLVTSRILFIGALEGVRAPVRQRVTAERSTPTKDAKASSVSCFQERYSDKVIGTMCHTGRAETRANCANAALAGISAFRHRQGMETWPNRVREWRKRRGLSQKALADELDCHHTFVGRIERGDRRLTDAMISQLARILKVSANDIIKADDQVATEESIARMSGLLRTMTMQEQEMVLNVAETVASRGSKRAS